MASIVYKGVFPHNLKSRSRVIKKLAHHDLAPLFWDSLPASSSVGASYIFKMTTALPDVVTREHNARGQRRLLFLCISFRNKKTFPQSPSTDLPWFFIGQNCMRCLHLNRFQWSIWTHCDWALRWLKIHSPILVILWTGAGWTKLWSSIKEEMENEYWIDDPVSATWHQSVMRVHQNKVCKTLNTVRGTLSQLTKI